MQLENYYAPDGDNISKNGHCDIGFSCIFKNKFEEQGGEKELPGQRRGTHQQVIKK